ncbi:AAA family ATPase [Tepidibacter hydrothermalis]|uniref:MoxR family ATPase n=1 Tax=Tepidibacter hydrothermalis TaxID=3036126 RepID=A0ABY8EGI4_9FIRM|nr:MoxR family ATPase [Tepidibacter hydrothermalis]WFD10699.1 MoxR family ATPase [Tepidibacter hydrothermalis]
MEEVVVKNFQDYFEDILSEVKKQIVGQDEIVRSVLIGVISGGNVLMEGTPGLGKTVLVKTFGKVLDLPFSRIQFTPDLMPVDITGTVIVNKKDDDIEFSFQKGPIFSSLVLADEINRATPKTQSAMLEAMQERTVTVGNDTYELPQPFFVLATQNPLEMEGTYSLPEAQLDRFMFKINIKLPKMEDLYRIVDLTTCDNNEVDIKKQVGVDDLIQMKKAAMKIPVPSNVKEKAVKIMLETHPDKTTTDAVKNYVKCGVSPRGIQAIITGAKVKALSEGRFNVCMEDIYCMAYPCLRHRIFLNFKAMADKIDTDTIIREILKKVN